MKIDIKKSVVVRDGKIVYRAELNSIDGMFYHPEKQEMVNNAVIEADTSEELQKDIDVVKTKTKEYLDELTSAAGKWSGKEEVEL